MYAKTTQTFTRIDGLASMPGATWFGVIVDIYALWQYQMRFKTRLEFNWNSDKREVAVNSRINVAFSFLLIR